MDLPSPDRSPYPVHQVLLQRGMVILGEHLPGPTSRMSSISIHGLFDRIKAEAAWVRPLAWIPVKEWLRPQTTDPIDHHKWPCSLSPSSLVSCSIEFHSAPRIMAMVTKFLAVQLLLYLLTIRYLLF